jgi:hypothetical protein
MSVRPLPQNSIDEIFAKLLATYGQAFMRQYEGVDLDLVKDEWSQTLGGFQRQPWGDEEVKAPAIEFALTILPTKPVSMLEFRDLCRQYREPDKAFKQLPRGPAPVPPKVKERLTQLFEPKDDGLTEKTRNAARFISMWGRPGLALTERQRTDLTYWRGIWDEHLAQEARNKGDRNA